jgi:carbon monoxide dehydrogenase subunit G
VQLEHSFTVPVGIDEAWKILLDIERIGPCLPGAVIDSVDGDDFTGTVKVKLGPINLSYKGKASFVEKDEAARRAVIDARGRDARGNGTAAAKVTATLSEGNGSTTVQVNTDLDITGKPAQFGRGVMVDVGNKLLGQFADALAATIKGSGESGPPATDPAAPNAAATPQAAAPDEPEAAATDPAEAAGPDAEAADAGKRARPRPTRAAAVAAEQSAPAADDTAAGPVADENQAAAPAEVASVNGHRRVESPSAADDVEPIDLLKSAGPAVGKRLIGPAAAALVIALIAARRHQRRR